MKVSFLFCFITFSFSFSFFNVFSSNSDIEHTFKDGNLNLRKKQNDIDHFFTDVYLNLGERQSDSSGSFEFNNNPFVRKIYKADVIDSHPNSLYTDTDNGHNNRKSSFIIIKEKEEIIEEEYFSHKNNSSPSSCDYDIEYNNNFSVLKDDPYGINNFWNPINELHLNFFKEIEHCIASEEKSPEKKSLLPLLKFSENGLSVDKIVLKFILLAYCTNIKAAFKFLRERNFLPADTIGNEHVASMIYNGIEDEEISFTKKAKPTARKENKYREVIVERSKEYLPNEFYYGAGGIGQKQFLFKDPKRNINFKKELLLEIQKLEGLEEKEKAWKTVAMKVIYCNRWATLEKIFGECNKVFENLPEEYHFIRIHLDRYLKEQVGLVKFQKKYDKKFTSLLQEKNKQSSSEEKSPLQKKDESMNILRKKINALIKKRNEEEKSPEPKKSLKKK